MNVISNVKMFFGDSGSVPNVSWKQLRGSIRKNGKFMHGPSTCMLSQQATCKIYDTSVLFYFDSEYMCSLKISDDYLWQNNFYGDAKHSMLYGENVILKTRD